MKLRNTLTGLLTVVLFVAMASPSQAVLLQEYTFERDNANPNGLAGWNVVATPGSNNAFSNGRQSVQPSAGFNNANNQGSWIIRTWDSTNPPNVSHRSDAPTGAIRTDAFVVTPNSTVDYRIGGGNHAWNPATMDPDDLFAAAIGGNTASGPSSFNLERMVSAGNWEVIETDTGPNANILSTDRQWDLSSYAGDTVRFGIYDLTNGGWGHIDLDWIRLNGDAAANAVPEPATMSLLALGVVGLASRRRRNRA
jgi:hypothetical protein